MLGCIGSAPPSCQSTGVTLETYRCQPRLPQAAGTSLKLVNLYSVIIAPSRPRFKRQIGRGPVLVLGDLPWRLHYASLKRPLMG